MAPPKLRRKSIQEQMSLSAILQLMKQCDEDYSGKLDKEEMREPFIERNPMIDFDQVFAEIDEDGKGYVTLEDMCKFYGVPYVDGMDDPGASGLSDEDVMALLQFTAVKDSPGTMRLKRLTVEQEELERNAPKPQKPKRKSVQSKDLKVVLMPQKVSLEEPEEVMFFQAAEIADIKYLKDYISSGKAVLLVTDQGETALHKCARNSQIELTMMLLEKGLPIDHPNKKGKTALFAAAEFGNVDMMRKLVTEGAAITLKDAEGWTLLHTALQMGHFEVAKYLMTFKEVKEGINTVDKQNRTALHVASFRSDTDAVQLLLDNGADPTLADKSNLRASHLAMKTGRRASFECLDAAEKLRIAQKAISAANAFSKAGAGGFAGGLRPKQTTQG